MALPDGSSRLAARHQASCMPRSCTQTTTGTGARVAVTRAPRSTRPHPPALFGAPSAYLRLIGATRFGRMLVGRLELFSGVRSDIAWDSVR